MHCIGYENEGGHKRKYYNDAQGIIRKGHFVEFFSVFPAFISSRQQKDCKKRRCEIAI